MTGSATLYPIALLILVFAIMAAAEWRWPRRALQAPRRTRWITHGALALANRATLGVLARLVAVPSIAVWADSQNFGLLNSVALPSWAEWLVALILLDFALWFQHLATHHVPLLWRMHKVHHADRDLDVTTAIRFHPLEIFVSTLWKALCVLLLGVSAPLYLAFELWLGANALFNHSNVNLPAKLDRFLRLFLVTPDMHLVHHSRSEQEQRRNYGFALTLWDRMFGTFLPESESGRDEQTIGLAGIGDSRPDRLGWSLKFPLT